MCTITGKSKLKEFTGYKVALKIDGRYYSPATGVEYRVGPVPKPKRVNKKYICGDFKDVLDPKCKFYNENYVGYTAVFREFPTKFFKIYQDMSEWGDKYVVLKMKLSKTLYNGKYVCGDIIAGEHIDSIEEV